MRLPDTPAKLHTTRLELYQTWYRDDPPVGLDVDDLSMDILRASTRCRKEKTCKVFKQMGRLGDNKDDLKMLICNLAKSFGRTQHDDMKIRMVGPRALADGPLHLYKTYRMHVGKTLHMVDFRNTYKKDLGTELSTTLTASMT